MTIQVKSNSFNFLLVKKAYNSKMMSESLSILKVFQFRADLKRMSTVCKVTGFPGFQTGNYVLAKGAPEVIGKFLKEVKKFLKNLEKPTL